MNHPRGRRLFFIVAIVCAVALRCMASDIKLVSGQVYKNVTIVKWHGTDSIDVQTQFGQINLPLAEVATIDGVNPRATPTASPAATASSAVPLVPQIMQSEPSATPQASSTPVPGVPAFLQGPAAGTSPAPAIAATPAPSSSPAVTPAPAPAATAANPPNPEGQPTPFSFTGAASPTPGPKLPWPAYDSRWNMDIVVLVFGVLCIVWIGTVANVQRSLFERRIDPWFWTPMAILLPGAGWLLYHAARGVVVARERRAAKATTNQLVARREKKATRVRKGFEFLDEDRKAVLVKQEGEMSGLENARDLLEEALLERASDVHIEPAEEEYRVRFRVDGIMQPRMKFDRGEGQRVVSALKTLAQIDVAEKRKAQDGRFRVRTGPDDVDFRVATANSIFGEKVVIRILNRKAGLLGLSDLGMPQAMKEQFERVIHSRNGMILATGPTGSGKTSTLYSAISQLDSKRLNIMTIEDPVEYELSGATQLPVTPKAGITYESGLRSILRQDPDVIFVGEMRDSEAAQIALRAALTGHLVFSSLHTRDAIGTILRLEEMGTDRPLLASSLLVLIAQRLVRVLCPDCREACVSSGYELSDISVALPEGRTIYRAKGCNECDDTGYVGRTGIFEMIVFDDELRRAVNAGATEAEITQIAAKNGFTSFRDDGAEKVLSGVTSVEEVLQAS